MFVLSSLYFENLLEKLLDNLYYELISPLFDGLIPL